jgi:hypothetical protein
MDYVQSVNRRSHIWRAFCGAAAICSFAWGEVLAENPYSTILPRNAFALKDPPPPPEPPPPAPAPKAPVNILLTGLAEFDDGKRAYLMVNKVGGKGGESLYLTLREGERQEDIEVLQIDGAGESVLIRNNGVESSLNFRDNGNKSAPAPAVPPPPGGPTPGANQPGGNNPNANPSGPLVIGRGGVVTSGNPSFAPANNPAATGAYNSSGAAATVRSLPVSNRNNSGSGNSGGTDNLLRIESNPGETVTHPRTGRPVPVPPVFPGQGVFPGNPTQ